MREIKVANAEGRDGTVGFVALSHKPKHKMAGPAGESVKNKRFLATTDQGLHDALSAKYGEDYGQALIDADPEVNIEEVGRAIGTTDTVYLAASGEVLHAPPKLVELIFGTDGAERERRDPVDTPANITGEYPLRFTKHRMKRKDVVKKFAFARTVQLRHSDGLSYDFLFNMAKELDASDSCVLIGADKSGRGAVVFQQNGSPYRAFLEGRVDGERYQLLLHLSNMELKLPEVTA